MRGHSIPDCYERAIRVLIGILEEDLRLHQEMEKYLAKYVEDPGSYYRTRVRDVTRWLNKLRGVLDE